MKRRSSFEGPWLAGVFSRSQRHQHRRRTPSIGHARDHPGSARPAVDAFKAFYRLEELRRARDEIFSAIEALVLPTMPSVYTVEQVLASDLHGLVLSPGPGDPVRLESQVALARAAMGFSFVTLSSDARILAGGSQQLLAAARAGLAG
jgi:hypothetical protein